MSPRGLYQARTCPRASSSHASFRKGDDEMIEEERSRARGGGGGEGQEREHEHERENEIRNGYY
jgi:hypothetical protein